MPSTDVSWESGCTSEEQKENEDKDSNHEDKKKDEDRCDTFFWDEFDKVSLNFSN